MDAQVGRATRQHLVLASFILVGACEISDHEPAAFMDTLIIRRAGVEQVAVVAIQGSYLDPERQRTTWSGACEDRPEDADLEYGGELPTDLWVQLVSFRDYTLGPEARDDVSCDPSLFPESPAYPAYRTTWLREPDERRCFVRSDENRPETTAFLDLLDRVIDESIDCPGS